MPSGFNFWADNAKMNLRRTCGMTGSDDDDDKSDRSQMNPYAAVAANPFMDFLKREGNDSVTGQSTLCIPNNSNNRNGTQDGVLLVTRTQEK
ncbi:hypothetical protein F9C07_12991 [Aspergillus flavus]|uniref:Uncharacterized protein n=1 Tax=Aspergillus flavus (strain ATCC 200026 / FGSC A1120 / IAM 13836 / NRRL 3357 / JCM 12722 / SRRC 167) TaxID=332952 RepID=A0A7U2N1C2_ASPFN|nr:hypothetical protein F9C07_12991 [Aspergillus flavus]